MALKLYNALRKYPLRFLCFAALVFLLTATSTHAGFEWIPANEKTQETAPPALPPTPVEAAPVDEAFAPMPEAAPLDAPTPPPEHTLQVPPTAAPVIQTKNFETPKNLIAPAAVEREPQPLLTPEQSQRTLPPTTAVQTRIMMPNDAPEAARNTVQTPTMLQKLATPQPAAPAAPLKKMPPENVENLATPQIPQTTPSYDVLEGFGSDMPLAIALTEIVPPSYAYSFGENVNAGQRVSWNGGKPWPDIINDMIAPLGLRADIQNRMVVIRSMESAPRPIQKSSIESTPLPESPAPQTTAVVQNEKVDIYDVRRQIINDPGAERTNQPPQTLDMIEDVTRDEIARNAPSEPKIIPPADNMDAPIDPLPGMTQSTAPEEDVTAEVLRDMALPAKDMEATEKQALKEKPAVLAKKEPVTLDGPTSPKALPPTFADLPKPLLAHDDQSVSAAMPESSQLSAPIAQPSTPPAMQKGLWEAQKGDSLRRTLDSWSRKANIELVWESSHDYTVESNIMVSGDFQRALKTVFSQGLNSVDAPLLTFIEQSASQPRGKVIVQDPTAG